LKAQPANTATTPYNVRLNISDLGGSYNTAGSLGKALQDNFNYYVNLDFSGSTFTSIGVSAFTGCTNITGITIPNSVTSIENKAFEDCTSLRNITIKNDKVTNTYSNNWITRFPATDLVVTLEDVTSIENYAFYDGDGATFPDTPRLISVTIPDGVTRIGNFAFFGCTLFSMIRLPPSSTPSSALVPSTTLFRSIIIPNSVTSIGDLAFYHCTSLTSLTIGSGVTSIGRAAFQSCTSLTSVIIPDSVTTIGERAFDGCFSLTSLTIDSGVTSIGVYAFSRCTSLTSLTIGNGVISIESRAFEDCTSLTSVTIPNSVTTIGEGAFGACTRLTSVTIPNSVTTIGGGAFSGCTSLTSVTFATGSNITDSNFGNNIFPEGGGLGNGGNSLRTAYNTGKAGTYTRAANGTTWTKQPN
jgi:hypothetical protein